MKTVSTGPAIQAVLPELQAIKAGQKATWESGDFGQVARIIMPVAEEFVNRLPLRAGMRVLDLACGTGNVAIATARLGCRTYGVDIAENLLAQARARVSAPTVIEGGVIGLLDGAG